MSSTEQPRLRSSGLSEALKHRADSRRCRKRTSCSRCCRLQIREDQHVGGRRRCCRGLERAHALHERCVGLKPPSQSSRVRARAPCVAWCTLLRYRAWRWPLVEKESMATYGSAGHLLGGLPLAMAMGPLVGGGSGMRAIAEHQHAVVAYAWREPHDKER